MPADIVNMTKDGKTVAVPSDKVAGAIDQGFVAETPDEGLARARQGAVEKMYGGVGGAVAAGALGLARGVTLGGSDALLDAAGASQDVRDIKESHPYVSLASELAGSLTPIGPASLAGAAGRAIREGGEGGGLIRAAAGSAAEGSIYGAGTAVSDLALSDHPLTAEHVLSTLSSNVLLGAGIGGGIGGAFKLGERALTRAGSAISEAAAARNALTGLPEDLAKLDSAGLKDAMVTAKAEHAADIASERSSLEELRVNQRAEMANQVRELHADLATERPIYQAVTGEDVEKIAGVKDIQVQLAKSFKSMRAGLDSEISVARDPTVMLRPLEMRQAALEKLQAKAPEIQATLAGDARGEALAHVDDALNETKGQIDAIRQLSAKNPVQSGRLTALETNPSARMAQIDAAKEALGKAPELGLVGKGAKGAAFAGGTALAHMIPGVGIAAPFLGKAASDAVGSLFEKLAGHVGEAQAKSQAALRSFLNVGEKAAPMVPATATKVLSAVRFGAGPEAKSGDLADLYHARASELREQTAYGQDGTLQMRTEARQALAQRLAPIAAVNPLLADKVETAAARRTVYLSSKLPKHPEVGGMQIGPDKWQPSDMAMRSFARTVRAAEDPHGVEQRLAQGTVTPEDAEAYKVCYPERYQALQQAIMSAAPTLSKTLSVKKKVALYVFTGVPTMPALQPNVLSVLQSNFKTEPGSAGGTQAPKPMPSFGALGSPKSLDKPTRAQERAG